LLSPKGNLIKEYGGEAHGIKIPPEDFPLFEGNIFTHNHPGGRCFTQKDILTFADSGAFEARATTPQGTYYSIKEGDGEINRSIGRVMQEEKSGDYFKAAQIFKELNLKQTGIARENKIYDIMGDEVDKWLEENAEEFGYVYTKGEI